MIGLIVLYVIMWVLTAGLAAAWARRDLGRLTDRRDAFPELWGAFMGLLWPVLLPFMAVFFLLSAMRGANAPTPKDTPDAS